LIQVLRVHLLLGQSAKVLVFEK